MSETKERRAAPLSLLCLASYDKGDRFLEEACRLGCKVFLFTSESLRHTAHWPTTNLEAIFYIPDHQNEWIFRTCFSGFVIYAGTIILTA